MDALHLETELRVSDVQGLYGTFGFPEMLLQKVWLRGDFLRESARTTDGRRIQIRNSGRWNRLAGPDFLGARLCFDGGIEIQGDVEVHLQASDWDAHRHAADPAYDRVVLHVVLFSPEKDSVTFRADGRPIPVLVLLPLLLRSLEELVADDVIERLSSRPLARIASELGRHAPAELEALLRSYAASRWQQKVRFAQLRLRRLGWADACHQTALEILGYRFNRSPMLRLACRHPLLEWGWGDFDVDAAFAAVADAWSLQGVRPANHPRRRLRQYANWVRHQPIWPEILLSFGGIHLDSGLFQHDTRTFRRKHRFRSLREFIRSNVCGDALSGGRLDTFICDGALPLLSSKLDRDLFGIWAHWFPGDLPPMLASGLRHLGVFDGRRRPNCHGIAQGLLGWMIAQDTI